MWNYKAQSLVTSGDNYKALNFVADLKFET